MVINGDVGDMGLLDDTKLPITREFSKMVDKIVQLTRDRTKTVPKTQSEFPIIENGAIDSKTLVVPVSGGKLSSHFGHCDQFAFIETQNGKIVKTEMRNPPAHEPGVLPQWLHEQGANVAIVGGMGESAQQLLRGNGIELIMGAPMDSPESLANQYLTHTLISGENSCDH